jgi:hypothetical protein
MALLPNHCLLLKPEEYIALRKYTVFNVKAVTPSGVLIAHGTHCFFIRGKKTGIKRGDSLTWWKNTLVPKDQPLYI